MEFIIQNFSNAVGWSILHSLWQGASIYLILFGIYLIFPTMSASNKYKTAFIGQSLLFISFIWTFYVHLSYQNISQPDLTLTQQEELALYMAYLKSKSWTITQIFPYIVSIYSIGLLVQVGLFFKSLTQLKRIKKHSSSLIPEEWQHILNKAITKAKLSSKINLLTSDQISSAITIGFIKPLIIFPTAYINHISTKEAEEILLHELAHIKRYDYIVNILLIVMETLLFFNPFVWLISKHIKLEREQSCDDFVDIHLQNPVSYSKTLLKVEMLRQITTSQFAMAATGHDNYNLLNRIKRINNRTMQTKYTSVKHQLIALFLTSTALVSIAWINPSIQKEENKPAVHTSATKPALEKESYTIDDTLKATKPIKTISTFDENKLKQLNEKLDIESKEIQELTTSPGFKIHILNLEKSNEEMQKYLESPEWKEKAIQIELNAKKIEEQFNSPEWKEKIAKIERDARKVEEQFNSPEWKEKVAKIERDARKIEEHFNSPEWKEKMQKLEEVNYKLPGRTLIIQQDKNTQKIINK